MPETQTACYAQMVSTIYDIEEIYSKGRRKVQVYAKDLLCYWTVRELGKSININRYIKLFTYLWTLYINQTEERMSFCSCDKAAIKLVSYMELEQKSISLERALSDIGYYKRNFYPRHLEKTFRAAVNEGKALRIQFKKLV